MKKRLFTIGLPLALALTFASCGKCGNVGAADLLHVGAGFAMEVLSSNSGTTTMDMAGSFMNAAEVLAGKCSCGESTAEAGRQDVNWKVYTSDASGRVKDLEVETDLNKSNLAACANDASNIKCDFLSTGYYIIANILDFRDDVIERNEDNNDLGSRWGGRPQSAQDRFNYEREKYGNNFKYQLVYVEVKDEVKVYDDFGNQIHVRLAK